MSPPLVSVIVPTKDRRARLATALDSIAAQTHPAVECIVVDDGGADVSDVAAAHDPRGIVTCVRLPASRERSAARNAGLAIARGTYVAYLDDDDWFDPQHLGVLVAACERERTPVAYSLARRVVERRAGDGYVVDHVDHPWQVAFDPVRLLLCNYIPILTLLHRRDCLDVVGGFDETLATHEDWELFIRLARHWRFAHVPEVTCAFTWREDGTTTSSARQHDFVRTMGVIYRRIADEAARLLPVAEAHARFFRTARRARGVAPLRASLVLPLADGQAARATACIAAIAEHTADVPFDLVVVDDGTTDAATRDLLGALDALRGDVRVLRHATPRGPVASWNAGAAVATGDVLVFLHADVEPLPGWLLPLMDDFEDDDTVAASGPRLLAPDGRVAAAGLVFPRQQPSLPYPLYRGVAADAAPVTVRRRRRALPGACLAVRRTAFAAAGGFAEAGLGGFEDADLCLRLPGAVAYQPRSVVLHHEDDAPAPDAEAGRARFAARWSHPLLADEDAAYVADGLALRRCIGEDRAWAAPIASVVERARWERVAALQRAADDEAALAAALAAEAACWPDDPAVLGWAATVCAALGMPAHAAAFRGRVAAVGAPATSPKEPACRP